MGGIADAWDSALIYRINCGEHGLVRAHRYFVLVRNRGAGKTDYRAWRTFCPYCARLNGLAYRLTHRQHERDRCNGWYAVNREKVLTRLRHERIVNRLKREGVIAYGDSN